MNRKPLIMTFVLILVLALGVSAVGAQDAPPTAPAFPDGIIRQVVQIVADATGLRPMDIAAQMRNGATLAELITTNGGDVEAVKTELVNAATERINTAVANGNLTQERADELLGNLDNLATRVLNNDLRPGAVRDRVRVALALSRDVVQAAVDETGLGVLEILSQVNDGSTLADVITANGGSVDNVIAAAVAAATEQINTALSEAKITQEQADNLLGALQETVTNAVNGGLDGSIVRQAAQRLLGDSAVRQIADAAGMDAQSVIAELQSGKSAATILGEHGVDVNTFIDNVVNTAAERLNQQVTDGKLTQEVVDRRLAALRERLTNLANQTRPAASGG
ncbi:MAG: hypothetical protein K8I60_14340 [Anaerolineae bacterium]|nr:hypothetical protein [Anaerolineae bacterium]